MSQHRSTHPHTQPDQPEEYDAALWERRALRWDMADAGRAAWTPEATHCADPADCPTYLAALAALRLNPETARDVSIDDLTRVWRSGYDDAAETHATAERWGRVLAVMEHRSVRADLDW